MYTSKPIAMPSIEGKQAMIRKILSTTPTDEVVIDRFRKMDLLNEDFSWNEVKLRVYTYASLNNIFLDALK